jgi:hypothetical protein
MFVIDHMVSECLAKQLGRKYGADAGGHSNIFGFAKDGFPIYGPFQSNSYARSCWKTRNYGSETTGCPTGRRSCVLVDPFDPSQGVTTLASEGPSFSATITNPYGGTFTTINGVFFEDYYFDSACKALGGVYLDEYNGHAHGTYPYHYHLTLDSFPYAVGPKF